MFTRESYDPVFFERVRREQPRLHPQHHGLVRIAHAEGLEELAGLDAELDLLAARRRQIVARVDACRRRLWPNMTARQHRRMGRPGEIPMPPAPADARPLSGRNLRRVAVAVLARHGALPLREIHGLLHRYGYSVVSPRSVQRLADALAYEVRCGRLDRLERGVYGLAAGVEPSTDGLTDPALLRVDPLPWAPPSPDAPPSVDPPIVDVDVADDPERWSDGQWPAMTQLGASICDGPIDRDARSLADDLDATVAATRARIAALIAQRMGPPPLSYDLGASERARAAYRSRRQPHAADASADASDLARDTAGDSTPYPRPAPPDFSPLWTDSLTNRSISGPSEDPGTGVEEPPGSGEGSARAG